MLVNTWGPVNTWVSGPITVTVSGDVQAQPATTAGTVEVPGIVSVFGTAIAAPAVTAGAVDAFTVVDITGAVQAQPASTSGSIFTFAFVDVNGAVQAQPAVTTGFLPAGEAGQIQDIRIKTPAGVWLPIKPRQLNVQAGSEAAPSISFFDQPDSGLFLDIPDDDTVKMSVKGVIKVEYRPDLLRYYGQLESQRVGGAVSAHLRTIVDGGGAGLVINADGLSGAIEQFAPDGGGGTAREGPWITFDRDGGVQLWYNDVTNPAKRLSVDDISTLIHGNLDNPVLPLNPQQQNAAIFGATASGALVWMVGSGVGGIGNHLVIQNFNSDRLVYTVVDGLGGTSNLLRVSGVLSRFWWGVGTANKVHTDINEFDLTCQFQVKSAQPAPIAPDDLTRKDYVDARTLAGYGGVVSSIPSTLGDGTISFGTWDAISYQAGSVTLPIDVTQDFAANGLRFTSAGVWVVTILTTLSFDEAQSGRTCNIRIWNDSKSVALSTTPVYIGRNQDGLNFYAQLLIDIPQEVVDDVDLIQIEIGDASATISNVVQETARFEAIRASGF